ncbi:hypothetical protein E0L36_24525 [Streptomyces sp. AJS327]|uniref:hypothetical protein n=1 Tax=Streptomyces sp. AJS327 TaxID=2545265 RepID=UPI0015DF46BF|nr:hypothetical protein [Streptomyces sp. AJS327]MBA0053903.1 hypothetical protein [Streptomyces sp. AJS327]
MTAENEGSDAPRGGDDPFAYLYRQDGGDGSTDQAASTSRPGQPGQPGVPRRSYNQVRPVGQRQYGMPQQRPQPPGDSAHYAAPETMPGGRVAARQHGQPSSGPNRNGLLIGAIAVVAAVVVGIGAAVLFNGDDTAVGDEPRAGADAGQRGGDEDRDSQGGGDEEDEDADQGEKPQGLPKEAAASLRLEGGTKTASDIPGAESPGGTYVAGIDSGEGASASWQPELAEAGTYNLYVRYGVPGEDMHLSLTVNGKAHGTGLDMKNHARAEKGDWEKGWSYTYSTVQLTKGKNDVRISCEDGDRCGVNLDRVWIKPA